MTVQILNIKWPTDRREIRIPKKEYSRRDGYQAYLVIDRKTGRIEIQAKFRTSRAKMGNVVHCQIWIFDRTNGYGKAGGYGYDKTSTALGLALRSAGIDTSGLEGTGLIDDALIKISEIIGVRHPLIVSTWF